MNGSSSKMAFFIFGSGKIVGGCKGADGKIFFKKIFSKILEMIFGEFGFDWTKFYAGVDIYHV